MLHYTGTQDGTEFVVFGSGLNSWNLIRFRPGKNHFGKIRSREILLIILYSGEIVYLSRATSVREFEFMEVFVNIFPKNRLKTDYYACVSLRFAQMVSLRLAGHICVVPFCCIPKREVAVFVA
jgi:hypothetical protein